MMDITLILISIMADFQTNTETNYETFERWWFMKYIINNSGNIINSLRQYFILKQSLKLPPEIKKGFLYNVRNTLNLADKVVTWKSTVSYKV